MAAIKSKTQASAAVPAPVAPKRTRLSQEDVPGYSLDQALRVPRAIGEGNGFKPTRPLDVAGVMRMAPNSGPFRGLCGAAIAYGLTQGGPNAPHISITPLGMRIVRPTAEGEDEAAKREALIRPKVIGDFLRKYDGSPMPTDAIGKNVLLEMGVPSNRLADVVTLISDGAMSVDFLKDIKGRKYVDLSGTMPAAVDADEREAVPLPALPAMPAAIAGQLMTTTPRGAVAVMPGVHINIEIHIAADASTETIQQIFKGMRQYVLSGDGAGDEA